VIDFDKIEWQDDRFTLNGWRFGLQHTATDWDAEPLPYFRFYKRRDQLAQYERLFADRPDLEVRRMFELGIWDGGSAVLWVELLDRLESYVTIDLQTHGDSAYFQEWAATPTGSKAHAHWGVDQADAATLRRLARSTGADLDVVVDDCSHLMKPTLASFEALFPLVRPGGLYIVEDWAWAHQPEFQSADHPWGLNQSLAPILQILGGVLGSRPDVIDRLHVYPDMIAVERGTATLTDDFRLRDVTARRRRPWVKVADKQARDTVYRIRSRFHRP
jgi:hypothetical protein